MLVNRNDTLKGLNFSSVLFFLFLFTSATSTGQGIKKETLGYFNYLQPRASTTLDEAKMYFLDVQVSDGDLYRRKRIEDDLEINKFQLAKADDEYDFTIEITEAPFKFGKAERKSTSRKVAENGREKTITDYYYLGSMGYSYTIKVLDKEGNEIHRELMRGNIQARGSKNTSFSKAQEMYVREKFQAKEKVVKDFIGRASSLINEQFTDVEKTIQMRTPYVVSKKFDYPEFDEAYALLQKSYKALNGTTELSEESKSELTQAIQLWKKLLEESDPENKKAKVSSKVSAACYFNVGISYFMLRDYENAKANFTATQELNDGIVAGVPSWAKLATRFDELVKNR